MKIMSLEPFATHAMKTARRHWVTSEWPGDEPKVVEETMSTHYVKLTRENFWEVYLWVEEAIDSSTRVEWSKDPLAIIVHMSNRLLTFYEGEWIYINNGTIEMDKEEEL